MIKEVEENGKIVKFTVDEIEEIDSINITCFVGSELIDGATYKNNTAPESIERFEGLCLAEINADKKTIQTILLELGYE